MILNFVGWGGGERGQVGQIKATTSSRSTLLVTLRPRSAFTLFFHSLTHCTVSLWPVANPWESLCVGTESSHCLPAWRGVKLFHWNFSSITPFLEPSSSSPFETFGSFFLAHFTVILSPGGTVPHRHSLTRLGSWPLACSSRFFGPLLRHHPHSTLQDKSGSASQLHSQNPIHQS